MNVGMDVVVAQSDKKRDPFRLENGEIDYDAVRDLNAVPRYRIPKIWIPPIIAMVCPSDGCRVQIPAQNYARYLKQGFTKHEAAERLRAWYVDYSEGLTMRDCCFRKVMTGVAADLSKLQNVYMTLQYNILSKNSISAPPVLSHAIPAPMVTASPSAAQAAPLF